MAQESGRLEELLRAARWRVIHLVAAAAALMIIVSVEIVGQASGLRDLPRMAAWFTGCVIVGVLAAIWYRARSRSAERLREAVRKGSPIHHVEVTFLRVAMVPIGSEVDMETIDDAGVARHLAFGFWTREAGERLVELIGEQTAAAAAVVVEPASRPALPHAVVVRPSSARRRDDVG